MPTLAMQIIDNSTCLRGTIQGNYGHLVFRIILRNVKNFDRLSLFSFKSLNSGRVAQSVARLTEEPEVTGSIPAVWPHSFVEIDHEIFITVIFSLY